MAYDEGVAERIRAVLDGQPGVSEQRFFGGLNDELVVRVGPDAFDDALGRPHARPMDFTGRPMKGWVYVAPNGFSEDAELLK